MDILTPPQIYHFLDGVPDWQYEHWTLHNTYEFTSFLEAVAFVNDLIEPIEYLQHHPNITIMYNKVRITTCTHDANDSITDKDIALVQAIEEMLE